MQVTDSICRELSKFPQHSFTVVLSPFLKGTGSTIEKYDNVELYFYKIRNNIATIVFGRDRFLDGLVKDKRIDIVLSIFGPSRWEPNRPHLCGFAMAFSVFPESPYFKKMGRCKLLFLKTKYSIYNYFYKRKTKHFYTESPFISQRLGTLFKKAHIYTVSNYYNQIFDQPTLWRQKKCPSFNGVTILLLANYYPHKNLEIAASITRILIEQHPNFLFRFVMSIDRNQLKADLNGIDNHFVFLGEVDNSECPFLYQLSDILFQPSLIECFTATYPEAMRMGVPIVTTDLEFAHVLCGEAACYYNAIEAHSAAEAIYRVASNKKYASQLVEKGKAQLLTFDNYEQRAEKIIDILQNIFNKEMTHRS